MKNLLLIAAAIFSLKLGAQTSILLTNVATSSTIAPNAIIDITIPQNATRTVTMDITNTGASTFSYSVKRYDVLLHSNGTSTASAYFCFAGNCFPDFVDAAGPLVLNPGQSASSYTTDYQMLTADLDEASTAGFSIVKYTFKNSSNPNDTNQFTLRYNNPTGISNIVANDLSSLEIFPNPATEATVLKVNAQVSTDAKVTVYNALGAMVIEKPVSITEGKNKIELNTNEFTSGIYFVSIKTNNSTVTKRLIVK